MAEVVSRDQGEAFLLFSIAFPLSIRTIPEILAGPWPLGFDTVLAYAPFVKDVETQGFGAALARIYPAAPLVYAFLGIAAVSTGAPPFAITKCAAPLLYGFLVLSLYYFGRRRLHWDQRKSLFLVLVTTLYFVPLRFSWDMYKTSSGTPSSQWRSPISAARRRLGKRCFSLRSRGSASFRAS